MGGKASVEAEKERAKGRVNSLTVASYRERTREKMRKEKMRERT